MTAKEFLTQWIDGKIFSEETMLQSYVDFAEAYHKKGSRKILTTKQLRVLWLKIIK